MACMMIYTFFFATLTDALECTNDASGGADFFESEALGLFDFLF